MSSVHQNKCAVKPKYRECNPTWKMVGVSIQAEKQKGLGNCLAHLISAQWASCTQQVFSKDCGFFSNGILSEYLNTCLILDLLWQTSSVFILGEFQLLWIQFWIYIYFPSVSLDPLKKMLWYFTLWNLWKEVQILRNHLMVKASSLSFPGSTTLCEIIVFISKLKSLKFSLSLIITIAIVSIVYKYLCFLIFKKFKLKLCVWEHSYVKILPSQGICEDICIKAYTCLKP